MPAGRGNQCERCYVENLADKRTRFNKAAFTTPTMAERFMAFGTWLKKTRGPKKVAQKIHRFVPFFMEIERTWWGIPEYGDLVAHFGAKKLRSFLLAMRWLEEAELIKPDSTRREVDSDRRRIEATLRRFSEGSRARAVLGSYHNALKKRVDAGRLSIRSVRLALAPAAGLVEAALKRGKSVPDQKVLDGYLKKTPGQRAALSGFVTHLRATLSTDLVLPPYDRRAAARLRRRKLREEMITLMRANERDSAADQRWITAALAYFHDMPEKATKQSVSEDVALDREGMNVQIEGRRYWIPLRSMRIRRRPSMLTKTERHTSE